MKFIDKLVFQKETKTLSLVFVWSNMYTKALKYSYISSSFLFYLAFSPLMLFPIRQHKLLGKKFCKGGIR